MSFEIYIYIKFKTTESNMLEEYVLNACFKYGFVFSVSLNNESLL